MHVLVTGGTGFIGSHLCEHLLASGHSVCTVDDASGARWSNLAAVAAHPGCTIVPASVLDEATMDDLVGECDAVIHLAGVVGVPRVLADPTRTMRVAVEGTRIIGDAVARHGRRLLYASSAEVYGPTPRSPQREEDCPMIPHLPGGRSTYALGKLAGEAYLLALNRRGDWPLVIARLFNVAGPRQLAEAGMVVPRLVRQALRGQPLTIFGDGLQSRTFVHVGDAVAALVALNSLVPETATVVNVGGVEELSMIELADLIAERVGSRRKVVFVPYGVAYGCSYVDQRRRVPSLDVLRTTVTWEPRLGMTDVIDDVVRSLSG